MALITYLTKIQFDFGALALLPQELAALGIARRARDHPKLIVGRRFSVCRL